MIEHTSDVSEAPKITCRAQRCRAHRTHKHLPIYTEHACQSATHEESSLGASTARPRAADNRLDDLDRSADSPGAGGHGCEQIERRNGYECGQEPRQVAANGAWAREGSAWAEAGTAADGTPCRTITLPTFSRQSQEFFLTLFTATVKKRVTYARDENSTLQ